MKRDQSERSGFVSYRKRSDNIPENFSYDVRMSRKLHKHERVKNHFCSFVAYLMFFLTSLLVGWGFYLVQVEGENADQRSSIESPTFDSFSYADLFSPSSGFSQLGDLNISMPWENGLWQNISNAQLPSFKEIELYANNLVWTRHGRRLQSRINVTTGTHRYLHVINPYSTRNSGAEATQNMTLASIEAARAWMQMMRPGWVVDIVTVEGPYQSWSDAPRRPATFYRASRPLKLSVFDVIKDVFNESITKRPFPLLHEILEVGIKEFSPTASIHDTPYSHVIFTNMDIAVMPHFYAMVHKMATCLKKTFFLNRVEIPEFVVKNWTGFHLQNDTRDALTDEPISLENIALAYNYTNAFSQVHPGYDCLVARIEAVPKILQALGNVFTAYPPVGSVLCEAARIAENMCTTARAVPATFHVGTRNGDWQGPEAVEYMRHNAALAKVSRHGLKKRVKCKNVYMHTTSNHHHSCYPGEFYHNSEATGSVMFPQDYQDMLARKKKKNKPKMPNIRKPSAKASLYLNKVKEAKEAEHAHNDPSGTASDSSTKDSEERERE